MIEQIEVGFEEMICPAVLEHSAGKIQKIREISDRRRLRRLLVFLLIQSG